MNLITAQRYAEKILTWLMPHCERIQVAGSVRRARPECADIDLVVIPRLDVTRDMFGTVLTTRNVTWCFLCNYIAQSNGTAKWLAGQENEHGKNWLLQLPKCQCDIFTATPDTWGTVLLCRTGSKEHNIWLASRVKASGGHWHPAEYLRLGGKTHDVRTEESIYAACGLPYIEPADRELPYLGAFDQKLAAL